MKINLLIPSAQPDELLSIAQAADDAGYSAIGVTDSVFYAEQVSAPYPYTADGKRFWPADTPYVDPLVAIPAMAAVTPRIGFYTNVLKTSIRQPLLVAKSIGSIAAMFPGRFVLGVGLSWMPEEFTWLGENMKTRGGRLDEGIEIIRRCLSDGWAEFHGKHYQFERLVMHPRPAGPVPIHAGGHSDAALRRAAQLCDGWLSVRNKPDELREAIAPLRSLRADSPRAGLPFEITVTSHELMSRDDIAKMEEVGVTAISFSPQMGIANIQEQCVAVRRYAESLMIA